MNIAQLVQRKFGRFRSFTIGEMVVVMVLTTIVVGMAYAVLRLVQGHMHTIKSEWSRKMEYVELEQLLYIDFHRCESLFWDAPHKLKVVNARDTLNYTFNQNSIMKQNDTIFLGNYDVTCFLKGNLVQDGYIDAIKIVIMDRNNTPLFVHRRTDASSTLNF